MMRDTDQDTELETQYSQFIIDILKQGHAVKLKVNGQSMHPSILSGSEVTITPIADNEIKLIKKGELILCLVNTEQDTQSWVLHRVVSHSPSKQVLIMGGDRLPINDATRTYNLILGRVSKISFPQFTQGQLNIMAYGLAKLTQMKPQSFWSRYIGLLHLYLYRVFRRLRLVLRGLVKLLGHKA